MTNKSNVYKLKSILLFTVFAGLSLSVIAEGDKGITAAKSAHIKLLIAGDSIVQTYVGRQAESQQGWGQTIGLFLKPGIEVKNFAVSGKSTKTFKSNWKNLATQINRGDFVLIQFGHNDSHKASRSEATNAEKDYADNLTYYVEDVKKRGGTPVLVTPPYRRSFDKQGQLLPYMLDNKSVGPSNLEPYAIAMRKVAKTEGVMLADLFTRSGALLQLLGDNGAIPLYVNTDIAHSSPYGARVHARFILDELKKANHPLAEYIDSEKLRGPFATAHSPVRRADFTIKANHPVSILVDSQDSPPVLTATTHFADDIYLVTGNRPQVVNTADKTSGTLIIAGSLNSSMIKELAQKRKINTSHIVGKWESYLIQKVEKPLPGISEALVIIGSDARGTAFGIFEVSRMMGVSPWQWWADIRPQQKQEIHLNNLPIIHGSPSIKYRGIFLNDEDWGLKPWAAKKMDTDIRDIGPKTYARIFELLLRLKANYIWTAMHPCTKAFFYYPENIKVARLYGIVLGSSHCEPMLRNNIDEWQRNFKKEYGQKPGPWRYDTNRDEIHRYWEDRVKQAKDNDAIYTVGMRGISDGAMPGAKTLEGKARLLDKIIADQRSMLATQLGKPAEKIPQIFCPYKEVLKLYQMGIELPDDITIVWADDNHGWIRQLSTIEEQRRSGHSGVYYHLSYWGSPADWLWLSSVSPSQIAFEMQKAYTYGADKLWVFNVGDIKPAEKEISFAMDMAWDIKRCNLKNAYEYSEKWFADNFGTEYAKTMGIIMNVFYRLAAAGKPEHLNKVTFSKVEWQRRIADYEKIARITESVYSKIQLKQKDPFFQLYLYPIKASMLMNRKFYYIAKCRDAKTSHDFDQQLAKAKNAYTEIKTLTSLYNNRIAGARWNGMMSYSPRGQRVFADPEKLVSFKGSAASKATACKVPFPPQATELPMLLESNTLRSSNHELCKKDSGGKAIFRFNSPADQSMPLYFYANCPDVTRDSWFVSLNGGDFVVNNVATGERWRWISCGSHQLHKGINTLTISQREPDAAIQQITFSVKRPILESAPAPKPFLTITADEFTLKKGGGAVLINGLGPTGKAVTILPFTAPSIATNNLKSAGVISAEVNLTHTDFNCIVRSLPTYRINANRNLRYAISIDGGEAQIVDLNTKSRTQTWDKNVMRGFSFGETSHSVKTTGQHTLTIRILDPGLAICNLMCVVSTPIQRPSTK